MQHNKKNYVNKIWVVTGTVVLVMMIIFLGTNHHSRSTKKIVKSEASIIKDQPVQLNTTATSAVVVDLTTGQILGEKNASKQVAIASQTKMLTAYAVLRSIKSKKIKWSTMVPITSKSDLSKEDAHLFSHIAVKAGDKVSVRELYDVMLANSANDAAFALGEFLTPKGKTTQQALQSWANELQLDDSQWYNSAGQVNENAFENEIKTASAKAANKTTSEQLAMIARADLQLDPSLRQLSKKLTVSYHMTSNFVVTDKTDYWQLMTETMPKLSNPNQLVIEGLKTGSSPESGAGFTGLIKDKSGHEFITVVNGIANYMDETDRYQQSLAIVDQVLDKKQANYVKKGQIVGNFKTLNFSNTKQEKIPVRAAQNRIYWMDKGKKLMFEQPVFDTKKSNIKKNQIVGQSTVALHAKYLPYTKKSEKSVALKAAISSKPASWFAKIFR
ncbi:D-alanyl-D-alanine carboxypeptidase [Leuconostoc litchii]|uniref:D-alanyl-D-alanine carboxypeptidase n=1 Tax=Leuconostoc litchii TaxID=1981069 RepID=A0A6P2CNP8_9LACO|nr:serine hydrolase [Leuconostoc litchii]TYC47550.1 D-alanyl-D-alanine carboxypeptidase [Leuconostoc litchii]GMA69583.1 D-alanyl-D-alanine carboxypeptidase [Leuconostoc litchii]